MILRTGAEKAKKGMTCSQFRRQLCATVGNRSPQGAVLDVRERPFARLGGVGLVDRLQGLGQRLAVFPGRQPGRVADQVHDAGLDDGLREHVSTSSPSSLRTVFRL